MNNKIENATELRFEILRLKQASEMRKVEIKSSFKAFKSSFTPLNILLSIYKELNEQKTFKNIFTLIEKVRDFFRK
jgi:hypothetical protein